MDIQTKTQLQGNYDNIKVTGIVISAAPVGEYDKRLVILTGQRGKVTVFAKGARRPSNRFAAGCRPFTFGDFTLYKGKSAYNMVDMEISNYFEDLSTDMDAIYYGFYFLELADYYSRENVESKEMVNLLYITLKMLVAKSIPLKLIRHIYELKMFALNGEYPDVFGCVHCGEKEGLRGFSVDKCGSVCHECMNVSKDTIDLNTSTFYTMQYIISSPVGKLYTFTVTDEVLTELSMVLGRWMSKYIDKEFKSLEML